MPSIAGMAIVSWLAEIAGNGFKSSLFFGLHNDPSAALVMLLLYGNLFCYIASYPILCFHATRVIDFPKGVWHARFIDGYILSAILAAFSALAVISEPELARVWSAFVLVIAYSIAQTVRLVFALKRQKFKRLVGETALAYSFTFVLALQRGLFEDESRNQSQGSASMSPVRLTERSRWRREIVETYRHLREHGNSAFIFLLELVLASLCYIVLSAELDSKLFWLAILLGIWALPAVLAHFLAQYLERRFSRFDRFLS